MKKGRFLHVPADSLSHSHGDQQLFGSLLGFLCFKLLLPNQNMWNILSHELGTERAISLIQVCVF